jgi:hypothetical protein
LNAIGLTSKEISMKKEIRLTLLCLAVSSLPAFAQTAVPACGTANFDQTRSVFSVIDPVEGAVNQQCLLTVYRRNALPQQARLMPALYPVEGRYVIELSGGGGGGGGGANRDKGGGGGGAGAAPSKTVQYLSPGVYKLTIGTGGTGGDANGGRTSSGNPTSLTRESNGQLVAGFAGADVWSQRTVAAKDGRGGAGKPGGSTGGSGGDTKAPGTERPEQMAQSGSMSATPGYAGVAGQGGSESGRRALTRHGVAEQANAGGGGGASVGSGGAGESASMNVAAGSGSLGAGGGGGSGGVRTADSGGDGGHGFIRLTRTSPAR